MNPVDKIKEIHRTNLLRTMSAKPRKRHIRHLDDIRSIGLILHDINEEEQLTVNQFTQHMNTRGCMVRKIEMPAHAENLFDKYELPKIDFVQFFSSYHYDLLIDATPTGDIFGLFTSLNTNADIRAAYADTTIDLSPTYISTYDLIIRGEGPCLMSKYLTDLLSYLTQIRK